MSAIMTPDDSGPRAALVPVQQWEFKLNQRDTMLVLQALGGRLAGDELDEAKALGDRLTALRVRSIESMQKNATALRANLERATGRTVEQILEK